MSQVFDVNIEAGEARIEMTTAPGYEIISKFGRRRAILHKTGKDPHSKAEEANQGVINMTIRIDTVEQRGNDDFVKRGTKQIYLS